MSKYPHLDGFKRERDLAIANELQQEVPNYSSEYMATIKRAEQNFAGYTQTNSIRLLTQDDANRMLNLAILLRFGKQGLEIDHEKANYIAIILFEAGFFMLPSQQDKAAQLNAMCDFYATNNLELPERYRYSLTNFPVLPEIRGRATSTASGLLKPDRVEDRKGSLSSLWGKTKGSFGRAKGSIAAALGKAKIGTASDTQGEQFDEEEGIEEAVAAIRLEKSKAKARPSAMEIFPQAAAASATAATESLYAKTDDQVKPGQEYIYATVGEGNTNQPPVRSSFSRRPPQPQVSVSSLYESDEEEDEKKKKEAEKLYAKVDSRKKPASPKIKDTSPETPEASATASPDTTPPSSPPPPQPDRNTKPGGRRSPLGNTSKAKAVPAVPPKSRQQGDDD